jgi:NitT/TauT family transport system substrate-binding protein
MPPVIPSEVEGQPQSPSPSGAPLSLSLRDCPSTSLGMTLGRGGFVRGVLAAGAVVAGARPASAANATLTMGTAVDSPTQLPVYIALKQLYAQHGVDVSLLSFRGDTEVAQALAGGSVDVALASSTGLLNLVTANQGVIGFYAGFNQADFAWLAQPEIKTWADLKGKTVGVSTFGSLTDLITRYTLRKHHLEPEKDVQIVQGGGSPSAYQAMRSKRLACAILTAPFKWQAQDEGFNVLGTQSAEVSQSWPKHFFMAKQSLIDAKPDMLKSLLSAHVAAIHLARSQPQAAVQTLVDRLKYEPKYAERAYQEAMPGYDDRGHLPDKAMALFWQLSIAQGIVKAPLPEKQMLDRRFIDTYASWAPKA